MKLRSIPIQLSSYLVYNDSDLYSLQLVLFHKKSKQEGVGDIGTFLKKRLEFVSLSLYPWNFQTKQSFTPGNSAKLCYTTWMFQGQKTIPTEIPHDFFLIIPGNATPFLVDPWNFHIQFFNTPGNSMSSTPYVWIFSGIAQVSS